MAIRQYHTAKESFRRRSVKTSSTGNFKDLETLLEQFASAPIFELGKPLPDDKFLPGTRAGSCPAAHNRALIGEDLR